MDTLYFQDMTLTWLESNHALVDGGPVFGVVPTPVWQDKYPHNQETFEIEVNYDPILIQYKGSNFLIDAGFETSKFNQKKFRNTGVQEETKLAASLAKLNLSPTDIDAILMTHMHDDHASGLTRLVDGEYESVFPNAKIYVTDVEWDEVRYPNKRTAGSYLKENWEPIEDQFEIFKDYIEVVPGIEMYHAGGHSNGLAVIKLTQGDDVIVHLSDLFHTTASTNPLWITAFDDYPMNSIAAKEKWLNEAFENEYKFIFYHEAYYGMAQFDKKGEKVVSSTHRTKNHTIKADLLYERLEQESS